MRQIKNFAIIFTMLLLFGCIKPYDPVIKGSIQNKYVVSGRVTNKAGWQEVEVSISSPIGSPRYIPVEECQVKIRDDKGHDFSLEEFAPGQYHAWMGEEDLIPGTSYQVRVTTPGGDELVSGFDKMPNGPPVDSVYYSLEDVPTSDPGISLKVMQFYIDLNAQGNYSQNYKWEIEETWEYHAAHPAEYYYDGTTHKIQPPDYSLNVCWTTSQVNNVFTLSTKGLSENIYHHYPLHHVDGHSARLAYLYSILVRQLAVSEGAYNYWDQMRINSNEQGGLYEKQPLAIKGNLQNISHPGKEVLGYFFAASETTNRYFYHDIQGIDLDYSNFCGESDLGVGGWKEFATWEYPIYFYYNAGKPKILNNECIDCRLLGGTTVKPDFWPK